MATCHSPQFCRERKGDHEIGNREQQVLLFLKPPLGSVPLTLGTMPILAGMVAAVGLMTMVTVINLRAECFRPTVFNIRHGLSVTGQHGVAMFCAVSRSILVEDVG